METKALSRDACERYATQRHVKSSVIISIKSTWDRVDPVLPMTDSNGILRVLRLSFDDEGAYSAAMFGSTLGLMRPEDAAAIAAFANAWREAADLIIVHCDGGVSRSAGVAAAIDYWFHGKTDWFDKRDKHPNLWCFNQTLDALRGVPQIAQTSVIDFNDNDL